MSITKKKKSLSSPQHSIKEHQDETIDNDNKAEIIDSGKIPVEEIHTANDWEHADLGDEQRTQKFLRLMGAKVKRKDDIHPGVKNSSSINQDDKLSSDKKHCRSKTDNEALNLELEKQFNESLQSTILNRHHEGLGFHGTDSNIPSSSNDWQSHSLTATFVPAASSLLNQSVHKESDTEQIESQL